MEEHELSNCFSKYINKSAHLEVTSKQRYLKWTIWATFAFEWVQESNEFNWFFYKAN